MAFIKEQSKAITEQLRTMSVSQQIAVGLLIVVLLGGVYQMMRWAAVPEWTTLLDQPFTAEQIRQAQAELAVVGVKTKVDQDRIMIRGNDDDRQRWQAFLAQRGALPRDTSLGYAALIKDASVFVSDQEQRWRQNRGLETEISAVLRRFQGIRDANAFVDKPRKRGLGRVKSGARASVHVTLDSGDTLDRKRIAAIANFVAGAVEGLDVADVRITDGSQYYRPPDPENTLGNDLLERQRAQEDHYTGMIYDQLEYIKGLVVNVRAKLRDNDEHMEKKELGPPVVLKESETTEETTSAAVATGPGVQPNRGSAITAQGPGTGSTRSESSTDLSGERSQTRTSTVKPAGLVERLTASVSVPRSYLEQVYRQQQAIDPDQPVPADQVDALAEVELPKIRNTVKTLLQAKGDDQVVVALYYDVAPPVQAGSPVGSSEFIMLAKDYGPRAGLALLAMISLFFVLRIAKKAQGSVIAAKSAALAGAGQRSFAGAPEIFPLGGGPVTVGEAEEMHSAIIGQEVDEGLVRSRQIVDQISQLVKEDADSAASIVQNWLKDES
jgi:flagellar biosynthesis/type III secretory pathway M-ring protein FliF/YscJ